MSSSRGDRADLGRSRAAPGHVLALEFGGVEDG